MVGDGGWPQAGLVGADAGGGCFDGDVDDDEDGGGGDEDAAAVVVGTRDDEVVGARGS